MTTLPTTGPASSGVDAERAVLGAITMRAERFSEVSGTLTREDFGLPAHQAIWDAMATLVAQGHAPDLVAVHHAMATAGTLTAVGGGAYLAELMDHQVRGVQLETYARLVRDASVRRRLRALASSVEHAAVSDDTETATTLEATQRTLSALQARLSADAGQGLMPALEAITRLDERVTRLLDGHAMTGLPSGLRRLDWLTGGFLPGQMITVGGRPGMGKTSLALQIAFAVGARHAGAVAIYSLEMSREEVLLRGICQEANVDSAQFIRGRLPASEHAAVIAAMSRLAQGAWAIGDRGTVRMPDIRRECESLAASGGLALVVIDYLQLVTPVLKHANRTEAVSALSNDSKRLARDLGVPVLVLSQLSRALKGQERKRPELSDLRESGAIEQDSDKVIFVHRDDPTTDDTMSPGHLIVAKNRTGPTGSAPITFILPSTRFAEDQ